MTRAQSAMFVGKHCVTKRQGRHLSCRDTNSYSSWKNKIWTLVVHCASLAINGLWTGHQNTHPAPSLKIFLMYFTQLYHCIVLFFGQTSCTESFEMAQYVLFSQLWQASIFLNVLRNKNLLFFGAVVDASLRL